LVISQDGQELYRVRVPEGEPRLITAFDWREGDQATEVSAPREGGRFAVVTIWSTDPSDGTWQPSLIRVDLETGETMPLVDDASEAWFVEPGGMVFRRSDNVFYAPFDLDRAEMTGPSRPCLTDAIWVRVSRASGHLVYRPRPTGSDRAMVAAVDASGRAEPLTASRGNFGDPRVSPDGGRIAYVASGPGDEPPRIWVLDLGSGLARPVSPSVDAASGPRWMADGRLAYSRYLGSRHIELVLMEPISGAVPEPMLPEPDGRGSQQGPVFSADGQHVIFAYTANDGREPGLYAMRLGDPESVRPFFATPFIE
jgi:Tol biopolymer transport system component